MSEQLYSDDDIDRLLTRFDQTEPALQRRFVVKLFTDHLCLVVALAVVLNPEEIERGI
jgi:hypothetical protein